MTTHRHPPSTTTRRRPDEVTIAAQHDYVWARLPYLVPMAAKVARLCGPDDGSADLVGLLVQLRLLLLDHLDREEHMLSVLDDESDPGRVIDCIAALHAEHLAVCHLLERIRTLWSLDHHAADGATERALHHELGLLDDHVRKQIALEERLLAARAAVADPAATCG